jgi:hypothetical protein
MKFTIEIELGNDEMRTWPDIAESLRRAYGGIRDEEAIVAPDRGALRDINGNKVGEWKVTR